MLEEQELGLILTPNEDLSFLFPKKNGESLKWSWNLREYKVAEELHNNMGAVVVNSDDNRFV